MAQILGINASVRPLRARAALIGLSGALLAAVATAAPAPATDAQHEITGTVAVGANPTSVVACEGELYVANFNDNNVSVIDPATLTAVVSPIAVGTNPYTLACDSGFVYSANYGSNDVTVIDTSTHSVAELSIPAGSGASGIAVADGYVYVSNQSVGTVSVINAQTHANVDTLSVGGFPCGLAVLGSKVYVANLSLGTPAAVIDANTRTVVDSISLPNAARYMGAADGYLYFPTEGASKLIRVEAADTSVRRELPLPGGPTNIAIEGGLAYVTSFGTDNVFVVDLDTFTLIDTVPMTLYPSGIATYQEHAFVTLQGSGLLAAFSVTAPTPTVPGAPTTVRATAGNAQAAVSFNAPSSDGGSAITSYEVTANPGGVTATGAESPIIINGLTNGTTYTLTVKAINAVGASPSSVASRSVTPTNPNSATGGTSAPTALDATRVGSTALPPAPARFRAIRGRNGVTSSVHVQLTADAAGTAVRTTVVVVLNADQTVVSRIFLSMNQGDSDVLVQVPYLAEGYSVHVYTMNELGVSAGAIDNAAVSHKSTLVSRNGDGIPTLFGSLSARPILFGKDSATLDTGDRRALNVIARSAKKSGKRLFITGFANSGTGKSGELSSVSTARAKAVAEFLAQSGVRVWIRYWGAGTVGTGSDARRVEIRESSQAVPRNLVA